MSSSTECFDSEEVEAVSTRYTIDTPPIDPKLLRATVHRNMANFDRYLASRPIARHTADAFAQFQAALQTESDVSTTGYILDSGCGTGRSSLVLGQMYPDKMIVGVDRSIDRLGRTASNLSSLADEDVDGGNDDGDGDDHIEFRNEDKGGTHVQRVRDNGKCGNDKKTISYMVTYTYFILFHPPPYNFSDTRESRIDPFLPSLDAAPHGSRRSLYAVSKPLP